MFSGFIYFLLSGFSFYTPFYGNSIFNFLFFFCKLLNFALKQTYTTNHLIRELSSSSITVEPFVGFIQTQPWLIIKSWSRARGRSLTLKWKHRQQEIVCIPVNDKKLYWSLNMGTTLSVLQWVSECGGISNFPWINTSVSPMVRLFNFPLSLHLLCFTARSLICIHSETSKPPFPLLFTHLIFPIFLQISY